MSCEPRTAILFVSHLVTPETVWNYFQVQKGSPDEYDVYWVYRGNTMPYWLSLLPINTFQLTDEKLVAWQSSMRGDALVPGDTHIATIAFSERHRYDRYWFIEYDIWFMGDWQEVFNIAQDCTADLVAAFVESPFKDKSWYHWDTINLPYSQYARSFNPIRRVSGRVLEKVVSLITSGYWAHEEALLASVCRNKGWGIRDLNNLASAHRGIPLYTPVPNADEPSTLNVRPVASTIRGGRKGQLHHPVKPIRWFLQEYGIRDGIVKALKARPKSQWDTRANTHKSANT